MLVKRLGQVSGKSRQTNVEFSCIDGLNRGRYGPVRGGEQLCLKFDPRLVKTGKRAGGYESPAPRVRVTVGGRVFLTNLGYARFC